MGGNYLFSFTRGIKSKSQIANYGLSSCYEVYSVLGDDNVVLVKWENVLSKEEMTYTIGEVDDYLNKGIWIKLNN